MMTKLLYTRFIYYSSITLKRILALQFYKDIKFLKQYWAVFLYFSLRYDFGIFGFCKRFPIYLVNGKPWMSLRWKNQPGRFPLLAVDARARACVYVWACVWACVCMYMCGWVGVCILFHHKCLFRLQRCLGHTWGLRVRINDLVLLGASAKFLISVSKNVIFHFQRRKLQQPQTGEKTIWYIVLSKR